MKKIRVLIVDDAVVIRRIVADVLGADPEIEVVGAAANGKIAMAKLPMLTPDLVTLDVEMPEMDGIATLKELRKTYPKLPVIMFSTLTARGAEATLDALAAGASDYVTKPANVGSVSMAMARIREELIPKIKAICAGAMAPKTSAAPAIVHPVLGSSRPTLPPNFLGKKSLIERVVIGVSTGGPNALAEVIPALPADLPVPVLIVQHMPPLFTKLLAERLDQKSGLTVKEAVEGESVEAGCVYIAPGDFHMVLSSGVGKPRIRLNKEPPENSCRPAVDVLFRSTAHAPGTLAVVLTGMGQDGLRGCQDILAAGGRVIVQDEPTSVVWGMPGFVARAGLAEQTLPLPQVAQQITRLVMERRTSLRVPA